MGEAELVGYLLQQLVGEAELVGYLLQQLVVASHHKPNSQHGFCFNKCGPVSLSMSQIASMGTASSSVAQSLSP